MILYIVVRTARKDVDYFPGHFPNPHKPTVCEVDSYSRNACTQDKSEAEDVVAVQAEEYGEYFDYKVYELDIVD